MWISNMVCICNIYVCIMLLRSRLKILAKWNDWSGTADKSMKSHLLESLQCQTAEGTEQYTGTPVIPQWKAMPRLSSYQSCSWQKELKSNNGDMQSGVAQPCSFQHSETIAETCCKYPMHPNAMIWPMRNHCISQTQNVIHHIHQHSHKISLRVDKDSGPRLCRHRRMPNPRKSQFMGRPQIWCNVLATVRV